MPSMANPPWLKTNPLTYDDQTILTENRLLLLLTFFRFSRHLQMLVCTREWTRG